MDIESKNGILYVDAGFLHSKHEIKIDRIVRWEFVAEECGATYISFVYDGSTQHISVPNIKASELHFYLNLIEKILDMKPILNISDSRVNAGHLLVAADLSVSLLGLIIAGTSI